MRGYLFDVVEVVWELIGVDNEVNVRVYVGNVDQTRVTRSL